ncbi:MULTISPECIES: TIGR00645 family protein [unclassified Leucobacter]|uniref:TIGR00645 family protein n=1 Tax=unclassified Leucobacter TaxID=2621730 RepID=UPI0019D28C7B|nr:TIGR00645 family protein [Leucobacter sp. CX169]
MSDLTNHAPGKRGPGLASRTLAGFIFASRWLQAPLYLGLIVAQFVYVVLFFIELWHLIERSFIEGHINETDVMLSVLALIDVVMIANLLIMVIIGGYETFVSKIRVSGHHDEPDWLSHVNANLLKIKLSISIISISSIHLLKTFIEVGRMDGGIVRDANGTVIYSTEGVMWEVGIHLAFIISALALAWIDQMSKNGSGAKLHGLDETPIAPAPTRAAPVAAAAVAPAATCNCAHAQPSEPAVSR